MSSHPGNSDPKQTRSDPHTQVGNWQRHLVTGAAKRMPSSRLRREAGMAARGVSSTYAKICTACPRIIATSLNVCYPPACLKPSFRMIRARPSGTSAFKRRRRRCGRLFAEALCLLPTRMRIKWPLPVRLKRSLKELGSFILPPFGNCFVCARSDTQRAVWPTASSVDFGVIPDNAATVNPRGRPNPPRNTGAFVAPKQGRPGKKACCNVVGICSRACPFKAAWHERRRDAVLKRPRRKFISKEDEKPSESQHNGAMPTHEIQKFRSWQKKRVPG